MTESLERYAAARDDVADTLDALRATLAPAATWYDAAADLDTLSALAERLRTGRFVLAVVGEFSSGKSFLLNALLGKIALEERAGTTRIVGLLATDINPSTATITELSYATEETAVAHFEDGREERVPLDLLARFETGGEAAVLRVGVDSPFLRNGFVVADTPGLASIDPAHRRATLRYLPGADAVLYLIDTQQPFADGDAAFLGIVRRSIESIFIVQTKIDLWRAHAGAGEREIWEAAAARIIAQTALHAPGTPVFPLSARDYAEGRLTGDATLVERSRFLPFLAALDDSLVATTGRSRLQRAAAEARRIAQRAAETWALDTAALERDPAAVAGERAALEPRLAALDAAAADGRAPARAYRRPSCAPPSRRAASRCGPNWLRTIARAFDVADVARLRDRPRLHGIVDATVAAAMERFAGDVAALVTQTLSDTALAVCAKLATDPLPLAADAARAFDADPASGTWSIDLATGIRSTIVISALGGPAVSFVAAIAGRFAAAPFGTYMKRELIADMDTDLAPAFEREIEGFVDGVGERLERIAGLLAERVGALALRARTDALGALDRAAAVAAGSDRMAAAAALRARSAAAGAAAGRSRRGPPHSPPNWQRHRRRRHGGRPNRRAARPSTKTASIRKPTSTACIPSAGASPSSARGSAGNRASSTRSPSAPSWPTPTTPRFASRSTCGTVPNPTPMPSPTTPSGTKFRPTRCSRRRRGRRCSCWFPGRSRTSWSSSTLRRSMPGSRRPKRSSSRPPARRARSWHSSPASSPTWNSTSTAAWPGWGSP